MTPNANRRASPRVFDQEHYERLNESRGELIRRLLPQMRQRLELGTAVDVGCGLGYFSGLLHELNFSVTALDVRPQNVEEAARRYPGVRFRQANVEDAAIEQAGQFDLVLCMGLLYHLENPFRAIRNLYALTGRVLVMESMCIPGDQPVLELRDEYHGEDQGVRYVALYPSAPALVKMLYRAGYAAVYGIRELPAHPDFHESRTSHKTRTMVVASPRPLDFSFLTLQAEPATAPEPWSTSWEKFLRATLRIVQPLRRPFRGKWPLSSSD